MVISCTEEEKVLLQKIYDLITCQKDYEIIMLAYGLFKPFEKRLHKTVLRYRMKPYGSDRYISQVINCRWIINRHSLYHMCCLLKALINGSDLFYKG